VCVCVCVCVCVSLRLTRGSFTVRGSDGKVYEYLLKAREDLRQDERVMQLFSLVNTLLAGDRDLEFRHCAITVGQGSGWEAAG
jgi:phosphatidylinositol kinase/protein kinase (PI-3  family)